MLHVEILLNWLSEACSSTQLLHIAISRLNLSFPIVLQYLTTFLSMLPDLCRFLQLSPLPNLATTTISGIVVSGMV